MPKLVEYCPSTSNWKEIWDSLPYPESCEFQGFFYDDGEEDEEEEDVFYPDDESEE